MSPVKFSTTGVYSILIPAIILASARKDTIQKTRCNSNITSNVTATKQVTMIAFSCSLSVHIKHLYRLLIFFRSQSSCDFCTQIRSLRSQWEFYWSLFCLLLHLPLHTRHYWSFVYTKDLYVARAPKLIFLQSVHFGADFISEIWQISCLKTLNQKTQQKNFTFNRGWGRLCHLKSKIHQIS